MAEKDATARLRRAVKENNLFLVKRLIQRTDMRNPDTAPRRYTSLAWAAVLGHEETFEFLLSTGHDDDELSKDSENNTILMLLADQKTTSINAYMSSATSQDSTGAFLRMARLYYDRYTYILDWSNVHGKTALHLAALKGNEELVRMLCDLGADFDLSDNKGNTPLHYASSWGHIPTVQLLIERGCQYAARNNQGFTASDYAYSFSTRDTLQDTARMQFENNKKSRRNIFAQAAARGNEWGGSPPISIPPPVPAKDRMMPRMRSGSGTSRTTATSDSGGPDSIIDGQLSSSPSQPSTGSSSAFYGHSMSGHQTPHAASASSAATVSTPSGTTKGSHLNPPHNPASALSPIASRMRERDADAMEKYLQRNRSGSQGTSSTDTKSQNDVNFSSAGPSSNGDDITALMSGTITPRRLRPSVSAAQLRTTQPSATPSSGSGPPQVDGRNRSGTSPTTSRGAISPLPELSRSPSTSKSLRSIASVDRLNFDESEMYFGPPSQYAHFPEPPSLREESSTPTANGRRKGFHILSKPLQSFETSGGSSHRRGLSAASVRGS
ncbi:ankyrin repeat-containing domain protein [Crassisporium funariophilum]|nr:ankyrin repeat-containing domain protein [Crassisporium funariophilum]